MAWEKIVWESGSESGLRTWSVTLSGYRLKVIEDISTPQVGHLPGRPGGKYRWLATPPEGLPKGGSASTAPDARYRAMQAVLEMARNRRNPRVVAHTRSGEVGYRSRELSGPRAAWVAKRASRSGRFVDAHVVSRGRIVKTYEGRRRNPIKAPPAEAVSAMGGRLRTGAAVDAIRAPLQTGSQAGGWAHHVSGDAIYTHPYDIGTDHMNIAAAHLRGRARGTYADYGPMYGKGFVRFVAMRDEIDLSGSEANIRRLGKKIVTAIRDRPVIIDFMEPVVKGGEYFHAAGGELFNSVGEFQRWLQDKPRKNPDGTHYREGDWAEALNLYRSRQTSFGGWVDGDGHALWGTPYIAEDIHFSLAEHVLLRAVEAGEPSGSGDLYNQMYAKGWTRFILYEGYADRPAMLSLSGRPEPMAKVLGIAARLIGPGRRALSLTADVFSRKVIRSYVSLKSISAAKTRALAKGLSEGLLPFKDALYRPADIESGYPQPGARHKIPLGAS